MYSVPRILFVHQRISGYKRSAIGRHLVQHGLTNKPKYHPTSGLMQILHFNWLRYQRTISNSPLVAKLVQSGATLSFVLFPNKYFFNLHLLALLVPSLSDWLSGTKTTIPFTVTGNGSIADSASPHGLLIRSPRGLRV